MWRSWARPIPSGTESAALERHASTRRRETLKNGLREHGYVESRNITRVGLKLTEGLQQLADDVIE